MLASSAINSKGIAAEDHCGDVFVFANLEILDQLNTAIHHFTDEVYTYKASAHISSIGMHVRHILEFYQAFLKTVKANSNKEICYDNRKRNLLLETSKESAIQELNKIKEALAVMPSNDCNFVLSVIIKPSKPLVSMPTTLHRELYHVHDHTIHHMALIKLTAERQGITLGESFGLAKATQAYQETLK